MKNLLITLCALFICISINQAQETEEIKSKNNKQEKLLIKLKDDAKPDIYVDGKKFDFALELLDQNKIESVNVIKDKRALKDYDAPNGVVLIKTKKEIDSDKSNIVITGNKTLSGKTPVIIIDEKLSDKESLDKLSAVDIEDITVLKGDAATSLYGSEAINGVIVITTKKGKKGKK